MSIIGSKIICQNCIVFGTNILFMQVEGGANWARTMCNRTGTRIATVAVAD